MVTIATTGVFLEPASSRARYLSPGPIRSGAGTQNPTTSTSVSVERTRLSSRSPSSVRGRCSPGVSRMTSCASGRWTMPRITRRVVCGRSLVIATFAPTSALVRVDLPTLGRPTRHANPDLKAGSAEAGDAERAGAPVFLARPAFFSVTRGGLIIQLSRIPVTATVIGMAETPVWRPTARLFVVDPDDRVLLFSSGDSTGRTWWFTPGGGVHRGETVRVGGGSGAGRGDRVRLHRGRARPGGGHLAGPVALGTTGGSSSAPTRSSSCGSPIRSSTPTGRRTSSAPTSPGTAGGRSTSCGRRRTTSARRTWPTWSTSCSATTSPTAPSASPAANRHLKPSGSATPYQLTTAAFLSVFALCVRLTDLSSRTDRKLAKRANRGWRRRQGATGTRPPVTATRG